MPHYKVIHQSRGDNRRTRRAKAWVESHRGSIKRTNQSQLQLLHRESTLVARDTAFRKKVDARRHAKLSTRQAIAKKYGVHWKRVKLNGPALGLSTPFVIKFT